MVSFLADMGAEPRVEMHATEQRLDPAHHAILVRLQFGICPKM